MVADRKPLDALARIHRRAAVVSEKRFRERPGLRATVSERFSGLRADDSGGSALRIRAAGAKRTGFNICPRCRRDGYGFRARWSREADRFLGWVVMPITGFGPVFSGWQCENTDCRSGFCCRRDGYGFRLVICRARILVRPDGRKFGRTDKCGTGHSAFRRCATFPRDTVGNRDGFLL